MVIDTKLQDVLHKKKLKKKNTKKNNNVEAQYAAHQL